MEISRQLDSLADTDQLGAGLASLLQAGLVLALSGPMGAGKSELARAVIRHGCGETGDIPSPSFTLVQHYATAAGLEVWHMDAWRLKQPAEALSLGIEDAFFEAACLIEWPEKLGHLLPADHLHILLHLPAEGPRRAVITGPAEKMAALDKALPGKR